MCAIAYQSGSGAVAQKGQQAGEARVHEQARAQISEKQMRMDLEQIQYQGFLQKAQMQNQMDIEREQRAKAWELEKMEIASRLDFQKSERDRIKKETQYEAGVEEIKKRSRALGGFLSPEDTEKFLFQHAMQYQGTPIADKFLGMDSESLQKRAARQRLLDEIQNNPLTRNNPELSDALRLMLSSREAGVPLSDRSLIAPAQGEPKPQTAKQYFEELEALRRIPGMIEVLNEMNVDIPERVGSSVEQDSSEVQKKVGDPIFKGGKKWKIDGFAEDGTPMVVPF